MQAGLKEKACKSALIPGGYSNINSLRLLVNKKKTAYKGSDKIWISDLLEGKRPGNPYPSINMINDVAFFFFFFF